MFLIICLASGSVWGLLGAYMVTDGRFDRAGLVAAAVSPGIGIIMGIAAKPFARLSWIGRGVYTLIALFVATALFSIVVGVMWPATSVAAAQATPTNPFVRAIAMVGLVWTDMAFAGDVLWLWPLSLVNHLLIWNWPSGAKTQASMPLGLTATGADGARQ